jgi:uracil-DNA glycosylase family 4
MELRKMTLRVERSLGQTEAHALVQVIRQCRLCADRFAATATAHRPLPLPWFNPTARLLIAGQAPGLRVHESGRPFTDASGDRLRDWLGLDATQFYDRGQVAIVPMAFCFPGYNNKKSDLPPPKICAQTWHEQVMAALPNVTLRVIVGGAAHRWHLGTKTSVTETVQSWRSHGPHCCPLPHPSWRNTAWIKKHPWFEAELLPDLRTRVKELME